MYYKYQIISWFIIFLLLNLFQAQAASCAHKSFCSAPKSNFHGYVSLGFGQTLNNQFSSSGGADVKDAINGTLLFSLQPVNKNIPANNLLLETGISWSQPFKIKASYLPYLHLGLQYQHTNLNDEKNFLRFISTEHKLSLPTDKRVSDAAYEFSRSHLFANLKLDLYRWHCVMPYINIGLGKTWHHVKHQEPFHIAPFLGVQTEDVNQSRLAYSVGVGFDFTLSDHFWLTLGYQLNHLGSIYLKNNVIPFNKEGATRVAELEEKLKSRGLTRDVFKPFHFNNIRTQTIELTARYVFG